MDSLQVTRLCFDTTRMISPLQKSQDISHGVAVNYNGLKVCPVLRQTATISRHEARPRLSITAAVGSNFQQLDGVRTEGTIKSLQSLSRASFAVHASAAATDAPAVVAPSKQKIRIKLRSYWVNLIEEACKQILEAGKNTNAQTMGPVPLPTKRRVYCLLRSPHVDKDSREHFEIRTHRRLIDLANPTAQTIDALMQLDLPAGVDVEVKLS